MELTYKCKPIKSLNEISYQTLNDIITGTRAEGNEGFLIDLLKALYKLGVPLSLVRVQCDNIKTFSISAVRDESYAKELNLEIFQPDPNDKYNDTELFYDKITDYIISFNKNTADLKIFYTLRDMKYIAKDCGYKLDDDMTIDTIVNDIDVIFNFKERRCLKWQTPFPFRYWFESDFNHEQE